MRVTSGISNRRQGKAMSNSSSVSSSIFSEKEVGYIRSQRLARIATSSVDVTPDVAPVGFDFDGSYFFIGGMNITRTRKYKNILKNNNVALVIDDLKTIDPWDPRGIRIYGTADIVDREKLPEGELRDNDHFKPTHIRVRPVKKWSWGIDEPIFRDGRFIVSRASLSKHDHFSKEAATANDPAQIKNFVDRFVNAWNAHDAKQFSDLFEDNGEWTDVFGYLMEGKSEIERMHAYPFTTVLKDAVLTLKSMRVKEIQSGIVSVDLAWESTGAKTPKGNPLPTRKGLINMVLTKTIKPDSSSNNNSNWKIKIGHNAEYDQVLTLKDRKKVVEG